MDAKDNHTVNEKEPRKLSISTITDSIIISTALSSKRSSVSTTSTTTNGIEDFPPVIRDYLTW